MRRHETDLPLSGKRIVVTRAAHQASVLVAKLEALGAEVVELPTIEIRPANDYGPLDAAIERLATYHWLIFTSVNGVRFFLERLEVSGTNLRSLRASVCAIGPATRKAVERLGLTVEMVPEEYVAESLLEAFASIDLAGKRILLPRAAVARDLVPDRLRSRGATVDVVEAYRTGIPEGVSRKAKEVFQAARKPDWITFTSSSTVNHFVQIAGKEASTGLAVASIGPVTSATARRHGISVTVEAAPYTIDGLVSAILSS